MLWVGKARIGKALDALRGGGAADTKRFMDRALYSPFALRVAHPPVKADCGEVLANHHPLADKPCALHGMVGVRLLLSLTSPEYISIRMPSRAVQRGRRAEEGSCATPLNWGWNDAAGLEAGHCGRGCLTAAVKAANGVKCRRVSWKCSAVCRHDVTSHVTMAKGNR